MIALTTGTVFQHAYFVPNLEEAAHQWASTLGAGPFFVTRHHKTDRFMFRGTDQEADVSYAFGYAGPTQIQFIEQHDDTPSIYLDMYEPGTGGFHHIALLVHEYERERDRLVDMGFELACELHADTADACYIDTRDAIGCFTEIHNDAPRVMEVFELWKQAHAEWDGSDVVRERVRRD